MKILLKNLLVAALVGFGFLTFLPNDAIADILYDVEVQPADYSNVVRINFNPRIQFVRFTQGRRSRLVQIYFRFLQGSELETNSNESLSSKPFGGLPGVTVDYKSQAAQPGTSIRVLNLSFPNHKPGYVLVRPGPTDTSLDIIFGKQAEKQNPAFTEDKKYSIELFSADSQDKLGNVLVPREFLDYELFTSQQYSNGHLLYELNLGHFSTATDAEKIREALLLKFPQASVVDLGQHRRENLAAASATAASVKSQAQTPVAQSALATAQTTATPGQNQSQTATVAAPAEVVSDAATKLLRAKKALGTGDHGTAIDLLNAVLLLPPNPSSQEAQELIGLARERSGQFERAKVEFELYLKLFPIGPGADRVRRYLAELPPSQTITTPGQPRIPQGNSSIFMGSVSQYFYGGRGQTQTAFNTPTSSSTSSIAGVDQESLRTNIDLREDNRNGSTTQKMIFRLDNARSFIDTVPNRNRVTSLNYEYKDSQNGIDTVLGRQNGREGGTPGRFDGALLGYDFVPKLRANLSAGQPVDFPQLDSQRKFVGVSIDADNIANHWNGNTFLIQQWADGIVDRKATGGQLSYFQEGVQLNSLIDYDLGFRELNIGTVQGNMITKGSSNYYFLLDRRHAPSLAMTDALYNQTTISLSTPPPTRIRQLLDMGITQEQIKAWAEGISAISNQASVGFSSPFSKIWQLGSDFSFSRTGPLPSVTLADGTVLPDTPATGNIYNIALRGIGSSLFKKNDVNVFSLGFNKADTYHGELVSYNNVTPWRRWSFEPSMQVYFQQPDAASSASTWRLSPGIRTSYRIKDSLRFEVDYTFEHTVTDSTSGGGATHEVTNHHSFYLGYRWDL